MAEWAWEGEWLEYILPPLRTWRQPVITAHPQASIQLQKETRLVGTWHLLIDAIATRGDSRPTRKRGTVEGGGLQWGCCVRHWTLHCDAGTWPGPAIVYMQHLRCRSYCHYLSRTLPPSSVPIEPSISPQNAFHNLSADSQACDYCKSRASPTIWRRGWLSPDWGFAVQSHARHNAAPPGIQRPHPRAKSHFDAGEPHGGRLCWLRRALLS